MRGLRVQIRQSREQLFLDVGGGKTGFVRADATVTDRRSGANEEFFAQPAEVVRVLLDWEPIFLLSTSAFRTTA